MRIALDYDRTFTLDPTLWLEFLRLAQSAGHEVVCVTMRYSHERIELPVEVVYTGRQAKGPFMESVGRHVDVWIDDMPQCILYGAQ